MNPRPIRRSVDVVIPIESPVVNLERTITRLRIVLDQHDGFDWRVVVAGCSPSLLNVASPLAAGLPNGQVKAFNDATPAAALRQVWSQCDADIVVGVYPDRAATDVLPLVEAIASGRYDVSIGFVSIRRRRSLSSWLYALAFKALFWHRFALVNSGAIALRCRVAGEVLPRVMSNDDFFDIELLLQAERRGFRIGAVPVSGGAPLVHRLDLPSLRRLCRYRFGAGRGPSTSG